MTEVDTATWLVAGYAVFLILVAHGFDHLARVTGRRSERWRTGSFVYHADHDAWVCPQDQWLWPVSFDPDNRVMRYRATPTVCNVCPVKSTCTTSNKGREITREIDPWPHSEAGRFHRGIACTIAFLACSLPLVALVPERDLLDAVVLVATIVFAGVASIPLVSHFWNTPDGFPEHVPLEKEPGPLDLAARLDPAVNAIADPQESLIPASRRFVYGSDNASARQPGRDRYGSGRGAVSSEEHR
ncbi:MAG: hypothetical protein ABIP19_15110 [Dermatophilaceae bacterium]